MCECRSILSTVIRSRRNQRNKMFIRKSTILWSIVLIVLAFNVNAEPAKSSRRGGSNKKTPHYDPVSLSYGGSHRNHQQQHQVHQTHTQSHAPSAPALPSSNANNKPIGWNPPSHSEAISPPKTISNTNSAPYPHNPPPYQQPSAGFNSHAPAGPPPPYSANPSPAFNSHPPAGPPPPYSANPNPTYNAHPPAYQPHDSYSGEMHCAHDINGFPRKMCKYSYLRHTTYESYTIDTVKNTDLIHFFSKGTAFYL